MIIKIAGMSDSGKSREDNQDHYSIGPFVEQNTLISMSIDTDSRSFKQHGFIAAVADGLGGYQGGKFASRNFLDGLIKSFYEDEISDFTSREFTQLVGKVLEESRQKLNGDLSRNPGLAEAGTTVAGIALSQHNDLVVFHCGDSRVMRVNAGYILPLTVDHTFCGATVASGRVTGTKSHKIRGGGDLTRSIGLVGDSNFEIKTGLEYDTGDIFLIGTDGWHGMGKGLTVMALQDHLMKTGEPDAIVKNMLAETVEVDGTDNATLVMIKVEDV